MTQVDCEAQLGPLDGLHFVTQSVYTKLYLDVEYLKETESGCLVQYQYGPTPFKGGHAYWFHHIDDDSGFHIYKPFSPINHEHD